MENPFQSRRTRSPNQPRWRITSTPRLSRTPRSLRLFRPTLPRKLSRQLLPTRTIPVWLTFPILTQPRPFNFQLLPPGLWLLQSLLHSMVETAPYKVIIHISTLNLEIQPMLLPIPPAPLLDAQLTGPARLKRRRPQWHFSPVVGIPTERRGASLGLAWWQLCPSYSPTEERRIGHSLLCSRLHDLTINTHSGWTRLGSSLAVN